MFLFDRIGRWLAAYLSQTRDIRPVSPPTPPERLLGCLRPADVLLIEGNTRIASAIKYLTQSTWSHAALFVGPAGGGDGDGCFVEADLVAGVRRIGLDEFAGLHTRICRPVGLSEQECAAVARFALNHVGDRYDLRNVVDLARYLLPNPPVPTRWRRRMIALGSGDPTRAICSTLIAQAFQSIRYPILPAIEIQPAATDECPSCVAEIHRIRHHSLFTPRDFDASPYFRIVKPTIEAGFDFHVLKWIAGTAEAA
jgi:hypothetical protein